MAGPLDAPLRKVSKRLARKLGQRVILRQPTQTYTPATGESTTKDRDRVVHGIVTQTRRPDAEGVLRRVTQMTLPAEGLYVEFEWRLPEIQDRVVIGAEDVEGSDDAPTWYGGTTYRVTDIEEQWGNQQVVNYILTLER